MNHELINEIPEPNVDSGEEFGYLEGYDPFKPLAKRPSADEITKTVELVKRMMDEGWGETTEPVEF